MRSGRPSPLLWVALGGAAGAPARYAVSRLITVPVDGFPWSTLVINLTGSAVLGCFLVLALERIPALRALRPLVATGFLGAYTTYSTFAVETDLLVQHGHATRALVYAAVSLFGGIAAATAGMRFARIGRPAR